jgi:hypothetical protein
MLSWMLVSNIQAYLDFIGWLINLFSDRLNNLLWWYWWLIKLIDYRLFLSFDLSDSSTSEKRYGNLD